MGRLCCLLTSEVYIVSLKGVTNYNYGVLNDMDLISDQSHVTGAHGVFFALVQCVLRYVSVHCFACYNFDLCVL